MNKLLVVHPARSDALRRETTASTTTVEEPISHLDSDCFQLFLDEFSQAYPHNLNVMQLGNGAFHKAQKLKIPENIASCKFSCDGDGLRPGLEYRIHPTL